jgi:ATP-dependent RNA helicase DOB1
LEAELRRVQEESSKLQVQGQEAIGEYRDLRSQIEELQLQLQQVLTQPDRVMSFLRPGRLVHVVEGAVSAGCCLLAEELGHIV